MEKYVKFCAVACVLMLVSRAIHAEDADSLSSKYFELASDEKNEAECKKIGAAFFEAAKTDADGLNEFAWKILADEGVKKRDLELAMKVAKAAFDNSEGKSAAIVDTYAKALFDSGKTEEGIKWQKKAVEICEDADLKTELQETLKKYEEKVKDAKK